MGVMLRIQLDTAPILAQLKELGQERQLNFILSKTLNTLAIKVRDNLRADFKNSLHLRHTSWVLNQIGIKPKTYSTKTRLIVKIDLSDAGSFLSAFEMGQQHLPLNGHTFFAIPNAKTMGRSVIMPGNPLSVHNLNLQESKRGLQGLQRTFMVKSKETGTPVILQRVGPEVKGKGKKGLGADGLRLLYTLVRESKRPRKIHWRDTANLTVEHEQVGIFAEVMAQALADAKKK